MTSDQLERLECINGMLETRMRQKPRRLTHSQGVARTAVDLARAYGVDTYGAAVAGLLHDWDKVLDDYELLVRAAQYRVPVVGSPSQAVGVLHGPVAAYELPHVFDDLSDDVLRAIWRHTVADVDMSPLDMVVFVADAIEPNRRGSYAQGLRAMVSDASLTELFFATFAQGLSYVISTGRYLYPTAVDVYNSYAIKCAH